MPGALAIGRGSVRRLAGSAVLCAAVDVLIYGFSVGVAVLTLLLWWGGDAWWPGTLLLFGPRWVIGLPFLFLSPVAWLLGYRRLIPLAVAAMLFVFPFLGFRAQIPGSRDSEALRVVTLNVAHGDTNQPLPALVKKWDADVVALQECTGPLTPQIGQVAGYESHKAGGLCLLSRLPILSAEIMSRRSFDAVGASGWVVRYGLRTPAGDTLHVVNLHLGTPREGLAGIRYGDVSRGIQSLERSHGFRTAESERARRWFDGGGRYRIALGDFNAPVESRIYGQHWGDLVNAFDRRGFGLGYTRFNGWIRARIDHVLMDGPMVPTRVEVGEDVGSDHRPVIVDLRTDG